MPIAIPRGHPTPQKILPAYRGMGTAGVAAVMNGMSFNSEGDKVSNSVECAPAKKSIPMVAGVPVLDLDKIKPLCEEPPRT